MTQGGKPIQISVTLETGTTDSVRQIRVPGWTGSAVMCSRSQFESIRKRDDFNRPGVYVLVGPGDARDQRQHIYIGQSNDAGERLDNHKGRKDFWTNLVLFTTGDGAFNSSHFRHIEQQLYERAVTAGRAYLLNGNKPGGAWLHAVDRSAAEAFLENMLLVYPLLGVMAFQTEVPSETMRPSRTVAHDVTKAVTKELSNKDVIYYADSPERQDFYIRERGSNAIGHFAHYSGKDFMVRSGSKCRLMVTNNAIERKGIPEFRRQLVANGVLQEQDGYLIFTEDYKFTSPSAAAEVVMGATATGPGSWKDSTGTPLKETPYHRR